MNQYPLIIGKTDLNSCFSELTKEWDYKKNDPLVPENVQPGSMKKVWWKCHKGHSWKAAIYSRKAGSGCPYCAGNILIPGVNDLATVNARVASEWDNEKNAPLTPSEVAAGTSKKCWWRCSEGHSWQAVVSSRVSGKGCPYCAGRKVWIGFNDLAHTNPILAEQWDFIRNDTLTPIDVTAKSHKKVWWIDEYGHYWKASIANRSNGCGCAYCSGKKVWKGFNDAESQCSELMDEWDYEKNEIFPSEITTGSQKKVWWKCKKNHSWKSLISDRRNGNGCPVCANRKIISGINDLAHIHPELMKEWDYEKNGIIDPYKIGYRSRKKVWWKCSEGHSFRTEIYHRHKGHGCPECSSKTDKHIVKTGENDLASYSPMIALEWDYERNVGITPENIMPFSNRRVWWKCENGHHWQCAVQTRQRGTGCPYCIGKIHYGSKLI